MAASKSHLPCADFDLVDEGRDRRNALAHECKLLDEADCRRFIGAIGTELRAWRVL